MPEPHDQQLLQEFAHTNSEAAFTMLVSRYVNLVYSTALRFSGNPHRAEEITQAVFIMLARKADWRAIPRLPLHYVEGHITPQGFGDFYKPAEERLNQLLAELPKLQADVDFLKVNQISTEDVMVEANALYAKWPSLPLDDRRKIAEAVCEKIVIGHGEIDITYSHLPSSKELCKKSNAPFGVIFLYITIFS